MTLHEISSQFLTLLELAEDDTIDTQIINDTLEGLEGEFEAKADGYATVLKHLDADIKMLREEEDRLAAKRRTISNNIDKLKYNLEEAMRATGKLKFKTTMFSYSIQKNPASVAIDDEAKIPKKWWIKQEPKLDKKGIIEFLKENNKPVAWAHLTQSESLRIR